MKFKSYRDVLLNSRLRKSVLIKNEIVGISRFNCTQNIQGYKAEAAETSDSHS